MSDDALRDRLRSAWEGRISGCQLGITLASLALGAPGEPAVSRLWLALAEAAENVLRMIELEVRHILQPRIDAVHEGAHG